MISHLHIENIAVVKTTDVYFSSGFNAITGETGAGKSIIITSLNAVFGGRLNRDMIREGCEKAVISAVISEIPEEKIKFIHDLGYEVEENGLLLHRELLQSGKNICKINGRPSTVSILKQLRVGLIDICNQHEGYRLLAGENHIKYVDLFGKLGKELEEYRETYCDMTNIKNKIEKFSLDECEAQRKTEFLQYEIDEIENADIKEGEGEKLAEIKKKHNNQQKILSFLTQIKELLNGNDVHTGALEGLQMSSELLFKTAEYIKEMEPVAQKLQNLYYEALECFNEVEAVADDMEYDPRELEYAEERLDILYRLRRKYGMTEKDILDFLEASKKELSEIKNREYKIQELEAEFEKIRKICEEKADKISEKRKVYGKAFGEKVENELRFLDMPSVKFKIEQEKTAIGLNGCDKIKFFISVNAGESLKPIENTASGGEVSRIMLGIKNVVSEGEGDTVIFDEIDVGVSGNAANKIGLKLKKLSKEKQVICITHLAQIAALAQEHILIEKKTENGRTFSSTHKLDFEGRKRELARIIGGINISNSTLKAAEDIINANKE